MGELRGLDAWITGGRYSKCYMLVYCGMCGDQTIVCAETEYGATYWEPEECSNCHEQFYGDEEWEEYYPEMEGYD